MSSIIGLLVRQDHRFLLAVVGRRVGAVDRMMRVITRLGDASVTIGATLALCLGILPGLEQAGRSAAVLLVGSHLGVQLLKRGINRPRPSLPENILAAIAAPDRFSFPSGHAAASMSIALPVAAAAPPMLGGALLTVAAFVGFSRCYLGVHYPGDVLAGWLLVIAANWLVGAGLIAH